VGGYRWGLLLDLWVKQDKVITSFQKPSLALSTGSIASSPGQSGPYEGVISQTG